jgi:YD repeat-containing protein
MALSAEKLTGAATHLLRLAATSSAAASTDSSGTVTIYDARGKVISREPTSGTTTTIYDAGGRSVGRVTTNR